MENFKFNVSIMCNNVLLGVDDTFEPQNIVYGDPCSEEKYMLEPEDVFAISLDGNLYIKNNAGRYDVYNSKQYCMETVDDTLEVLVCFGTEKLCTYMQQIRILPKKFIFELTSVAFLIVTFVVYTFVKKLRTVHGLALRYHVSCLIVAFSVLAAVQLAGGREIPDWMCITAGYVIEISFLAYFFWLTVMCIETYKSITANINTQINGNREINGKINDKRRLRPTIGRTSCWFEKNSSSFYYFYLPMGVSLIVNFVTFLWTFKIQRQTQPQFKTLFRKSFLLFLMMGLNWFSEILTWAFPEYIPTELLTGFDIFNASHRDHYIFTFRLSQKFELCKKEIVTRRDTFRRQRSAEPKGTEMKLLGRK
ncbi:probable G-protein coupled receptor Mth-like 11 [Ctenocephalides felis]|uniref:probable G-protein coupled receptor Mth-like 11 n=1 Tax=Ctenocephalides felis TaxID=7515 RepID=UPI000E6E1646|nr:probable G-protein coupled receptor Mth-like 11 [Ctenocephalides felis]